MSSVNKVILIGRLGQDPEVRYTTGGQAVATLSVATSEVWKDKDNGQKQERTEWHRVIYWGKQAELAKSYLSKGKQIYVEGRLQTRSWDDKTGVKRYTTEIIGTALTFLSPATTNGANPSFNNSNNSGPDHNFMQENQSSMPSAPPNMGNFASEDLPF